ncbi:unnamed protein product [Cylicostephanus goldi]|uniref:Uncharacterized protein n=1 Tax=Cylicostephanus goldi TaxID=71465 RepID=A0A3P6T9H0_CYLGO|nr:unnamed protein product [Cylicostephanus goldi]
MAVLSHTRRFPSQELEEKEYHCFPQIPLNLCFFLVIFGSLIVMCHAEITRLFIFTILMIGKGFVFWVFVQML